jgi:glycyl-tRNA synthetase
MSVSPEVQTAAFNFMARRLEQLLVDSGISVEVARAVLNQRSNDPLLAQKTAKELQARLSRPGMY